MSSLLVFLPRVDVAEPGEHLKDELVAREERSHRTHVRLRFDEEFRHGRERIVEEERKPADDEDAHHVGQGDRRLLLLGELRQTLAERRAGRASHWCVALRRAWCVVRCTGIVRRMPLRLIAGRGQLMVIVAGRQA